MRDLIIRVTMVPGPPSEDEDKAGKELILNTGDMGWRMEGAGTLYPRDQALIATISAAARSWKGL